MKEKNDFGFCFIKPKGLRLIKPNNNLTETYKRKSSSALNMLNAAKEKQENEWILDTSYYAKYFIVYALFMKAGIKSEIHDCTIFALKSLFADENLISKETYEELEKSKEQRVGALYYDKDFGKEEIMKRANAAPGFCLEVEKTIEKLSQEDIERVRKKFENLQKEAIIS